MLLFDKGDVDGPADGVMSNASKTESDPETVQQELSIHEVQSVLASYVSR
jgi:hypothetical protein